MRWLDGIKQGVIGKIEKRIVRGHAWLSKIK
jgi:hypothetical protein